MEIPPPTSIEAPSLVATSERPPGQTESKARPAVYWPELDLLRSLACTCMVLNHVAVTGPFVASFGVDSKAGLIGGFAPVLFFFATGLGYGVQSVRDQGRRGYGFLIKVAILLVADLDFFVFIGLSMLALEWIRRQKRSGVIAMGLGLGLVLIRFLAGPILHPSYAGTAWEPWIGDVTGTVGNFGYPLGPWLAFPMFGYVLGRCVALNREALVSMRWLPSALALGAISLIVVALALVWRGRPFTRYGSMSIAYFIASLGVLSISLAMVGWLSRSRRFSTVKAWVTVGGLQSFTVVPLHYLLIELVVQVIRPPLNPGTFELTFLGVLVLSFVGSAGFVRLVGLADQPSWRVPAIIVVVAMSVAYYGYFRWATLGLAAVAARAVFQLGLCLALSFRPRVTRPT